MIEHQLTHYWQPTNTSCSQASLAMIFSYFGKVMTPEEILASVPVTKNDKGEDWGTNNQDLARWCLSQGFTVHLYTADFQVIDLSWVGLSKEKLLERMEATKGHRDVPALGRVWSERYMQSYINFVKAGGELEVVPYMSSELLDRLLANGPFMAAVCFNVLHTYGRVKNTGLREIELNDVAGGLGNHSVVVYGKDEKGNYLIADPWQKPGFHAVEPERLLAAMAASEIEADNMIIQLQLRSK